MVDATAEATRKILLGVTGGVAAYKSPEIVRRLRDAGCDVRVVMTEAATRFVGPVTLQAVSGHRVGTTLWDAEAEAAMGHIELARWADLILVAPATADFIASLATGSAADLLSTLCLATTAPVVIAPAMNHVMWSHPAVQENRATLERRGVGLLGPVSGPQACGEVGVGRMLEPDEIVVRIVGWLAQPEPRPLAGLKVVVSAGPTREPIDPVRYISNRSSGKMGFAIAAAAHAAGAEVTLVAGPVSLCTPAGIERIDVETAAQMYAAVLGAVEGADIYIGCAAVSDYRPEAMAHEKIKRTSEAFRLDLVRSQDTLASVAALDDAPFTVGFAAETTDVRRHAREKLERKGVDMIAANEVGPACGFDRETNALEVFWDSGSAAIAEDTKANVARELIRLIAERFEARRGPVAASGPQAALAQ